MGIEGLERGRASRTGISTYEYHAVGSNLIRVHTTRKKTFAVETTLSVQIMVTCVRMICIDKEQRGQLCNSDLLSFSYDFAGHMEMAFAHN